MVTDFLEPEALAIEQLAGDIEVTLDRIIAVVESMRPIDAELDLRFSRYFGMTEGFFLRLQDR